VVRRHLSWASGLLAGCLFAGASPAVASSDTQAVVAGNAELRWWIGRRRKAVLPLR
jgi:hypothetical protein